MINNAELKHHGIKGMRWGVRKENKVDKINRKISRLKTDKADWEGYEKVASSKRFLGNPSERDLARSAVKDRTKRIAKLEKKLEKDKVKNLSSATKSQGKSATKQVLSKLKEANRTMSDIMKTHGAPKRTSDPIDPMRWGEVKKNKSRDYI